MNDAALRGFKPVTPRPLVERLRDIVETPICKEAASEIERLQRKVAELVDLLNGISRQTAAMANANRE